MRRLIRVGRGTTYTMAGALALCILGVLGATTTSRAEETHHTGHEEPAFLEGTHDHLNHFAVFFGATQAEEHEGERDDPQFTMGFDYERRLSKLFGLGFLADVVIEGNREFLLGIPGFLHIPHGPTLQLAPGWHKVKESGDSGGVLRLGLMWEFEVRETSLTPAVFYDVTEHENLWVLGLNIGKGW